MAQKPEEGKVLHAGFDTLQVAFEATLEKDVLAELQTKKQEAQRLQQHEIEVSVNGKAAVLSSTGMKGGYAFQLDFDGETGLIMWLKNSTKKDWSAMVKVRAGCLAVYGYEGAKEFVYKTLNKVGATVIQESINRADFAVDIYAPSFKPNPDCMVAPHKARFKEFSHIATERRGRQVESLTVGSMPNRQICVYEKTKEIKAKGNEWWFDKWDIEPCEGVWRTEVRAGKEYLKKTGVRTFSHLEAEFQNLAYVTLDNIRLINEQQSDSNVTRATLHYIWLNVRDKIVNWGGWIGKFTGIEPKRIITEKRERLKVIMHQNICGSIASYASLCGHNPSDISNFIKDLHGEINLHVVSCKHKVNETMRRASARYLNVTEKEVVDSEREFAEHCSDRLYKQWLKTLQAVA